ncbi:hypothetical protein Pmani_032190 [Petrolisthes manimaculis]|uniref:Uncharacterized protein n=1 Tax=Petrolisthes manimaculis TaxID=1843537 RepID=A0AAE1NTM0_9EUCA|nr:hypothetical protein Pmani_032190 [Petrolisthes manimaculis]
MRRKGGRRYKERSNRDESERVKVGREEKRKWRLWCEKGEGKGWRSGGLVGIWWFCGERGDKEGGIKKREGQKEGVVEEREGQEEGGIEEREGKEGGIEEREGQEQDRIEER